VLAAVFGLRQFKAYLTGLPNFQLITDHQSIKYFDRTREPSGQIARFLEFLSNFNFTLEHRPGRQNVGADALSRIRPCEVADGRPCAQCHKRVGLDHVATITTRAMAKKGTPQITEPPILGVGPPGESSQNDVTAKNKPKRQYKGGLLARTAPMATAAGCTDWTPEYIRQEQERDKDISDALDWVVANRRPEWEDVSCRGPLLRALWQQFESLVLRDGVLHRIFHGNDGLALFYQVVMPKTMRRSLLELVHADAAAHLRLEKTLEQVQRRAWWPEWRLDTKIFLQSCDRCASYHRGPPPKQARLRPMVMGFPGQRWCIDLVGPMPTSNGFNYVFTAIDSFTKFVVAAPIRSKDSQTVARMIVERIFLQWGIAVQLLSDCGLEFENQVLAEICRILGVKRLRTSGYRPQTNAIS